MKVFVTGVAGQLGHDVMNELAKRGYEESELILHQSILVSLTALLLSLCHMYSWISPMLMQLTK